jgi:hypothetical protein
MSDFRPFMVMPVMALRSLTMIPLFISVHRPFTKSQLVTTVNATNVLVVGLKKEMKDREKRKAHQRLSMKSVHIKSRISKQEQLFIGVSRN